MYWEIRVVFNVLGLKPTVNNQFIVSNKVIINNDLPPKCLGIYCFIFDSTHSISIWAIEKVVVF